MFAQNAPHTWLRHLQFPTRAMCRLLTAPDKSFSRMLDSLGRWPRPACSFRNAQAAILLEFVVPLTNCFVRRWFSIVLGLKPPLHYHNLLSFGKFQVTEGCLTVLAKFLHYCPLAVKPTSTPWLIPNQNWRDSLPIDMLLSAVSVLLVALPNTKFLSD
jgi:hypothetical protein